MRRFRYIILIGFGVMACAAVMAVLSARREPSWEGRRLSSWLMEGYGAIGSHTGFDIEATDVAVRQLGTNALPFLICELGAKHSSTMSTLVLLANQQSVIHIHYVDGGMKRIQAIRAFEALGHTATPALPQIRNYLADPELASDAQKAIDAILQRNKPDQAEESSVGETFPEN